MSPSSRLARPANRSATCLAPYTLGSLVACLLTACSFAPPRTHTPYPPERIGQPIPDAALRDDLRFLTDVCIEVHPDPYRGSSPEEVDARLALFQSAVDRPLTREEFFPIAAQLAASFGDSHTSVSPPAEEWGEYLRRGGLIPPFAVAADGGELVVARSWCGPGGPVAGDVLLAVDDLLVADLLARALQRRAGEPQWVRSVCASNFAFELWLAGARAPFAVRVRRGDQELALPELPGMTAAQSQSAKAAQGDADAPADWSLSWLPGDVALIDYRSMSDGDRWDAFLRDTFAELRRRRARGVIVDLRRNGGGDSRMGDALLDYVTDKTYRMSARKEWRSSARYRAYLKSFAPGWIAWMPIQYLFPEGRQYWGVEEGECAVFESEPVTPGDNDLRFEGPVAFLIGSGTFSSAMMLADAVQTYDLARTFGEETGGAPNSFGEVYEFDLPHSGLSVGISSALHVRADGDASDTRGVLPDVEVRTTPADLQTGRDAPLEAARAWILGG